MLNIVLVILVLFFSVCSFCKLVEMKLNETDSQIKLHLGSSFFEVISKKRLVIYAILALGASCVKVAILYYLVKLIAG